MNMKLQKIHRKAKMSMRANRKQKNAVFLQNKDTPHVRPKM